MKKIIFGLTLSLISLLSACNWLIYKQNIQQGNALSEKQVSQIHRGMTLAEVSQVLGTPLNEHTFTKGELDYVYFLRPERGSNKHKIVTLRFKGQRVSQVSIS